MHRVLTLGLGLSVACASESEDLGTVFSVDPQSMVTLDAGSEFQGVQDIAVDVTGVIWALQKHNTPYVLRFSDQGELLNSFGLAGSARGQLSDPWSLLPTGNNSRPMQVWDTGNQRLVTFLGDGRFGDTRRIRRSRGMVSRDVGDHMSGQPLKLASFGDGYLLLDHPGGVGTAADFLESQLLRLDAAGAIVDTFLNFDREFSDGRTALGQQDMLTPIPLWSVCSSGDLVLFDPFAHELRWYGLDGAITSRDSVSLPSDPITEEDRQTYLRYEFELRARAQVDGDPDSALVERSLERFLTYSGYRLSETAAPAVNIICDSTGRVWLEQFSTADHPLGYGRRWVVYRPETSDQVVVEFPEGFRALLIMGGKAVGSHRAAGQESVAMVTLPPEVG